MLCKTPTDSVSMRETLYMNSLKSVHKDTESPSESLITDHNVSILSILRIDSVFGEI